MKKAKSGIEKKAEKFIIKNNLLNDYISWHRHVALPMNINGSMCSYIIYNRGKFIG